MPCLDHGVCAMWPPSFYDQAEGDRNEAVYTRIRNAIDGPYCRDPWRDDGERLALERELAN